MAAPGTLSLDYQIIPLTEAPSQSVSVTLGNQPCRINVYTKSVNVPIAPPDSIVTDPLPTYENVNPVFVDLYVNDTLVIGGVIALNANLIVRDAYLGFLGDIAICDTSGAGGDPYGVPLRLPPPDLRNWWQRSLPAALGGEYAPAAVAAKCPGLGTRFLMTYWPNLL